MRTLTLDEALVAKAQQELWNDTTVIVRRYYDGVRMVLASRTAHCGGTDYGHIGIVSEATADALASVGVSVWR